MIQKILFSITLIIVILNISQCQVEYPEHFATDKKKSNLSGRVPLYSPTRCGPHELLYPGDQANDWICDCAPASLYHPESDACYPAFRKGPCDKEQFLVLGINKIVPECISNACKIDGKIQINNICYQLGLPEPCKNTQLSYVLGVNPSTLKIDCVKQSLALATRFGDDNEPNYDFESIELCARGCRRAIEGRCPTQPQTIN